MIKWLVVVGVLWVATSAVYADEVGGQRWTRQQAHDWYAQQGWLVGCNFTPSTAVNQLEFWQADTFDQETIEREVKWAAGLGMNTLRVYLHDLAWEADADGFKKRLGTFLGITSKHGIRPMLVLFDDCWNDDPKIGKQPEPVAGVHNSGWVQSPGKAVVNDSSQWSRLERYVKDVVGSFGQDERVLIWDLYNEPGNSEQDEKSLPLLKKTFEWARAVKPSQPLTVGVWGLLEDRPVLHAYLLAESDIISFHHYQNVESLMKKVKVLEQYGRPLMCTEWLARGKCEVAEFLPIFNEQRIASYNWGLVAGKTQTNFRWGSKPGAPEPARWHHDLLRQDGSPFDASELELFRKLTNRR